MSIKLLDLLYKYEKLTHRLLFNHLRLMQTIIENKDLMDPELYERLTTVDKTDKYMKEFHDLILFYDGE